MKAKDGAIERLETMREECAQRIAFAVTGFEVRSGGRDATSEALAVMRAELEYFDTEIERLREG